MRPEKPRPIRPEDPTAAFNCGNEALNVWLASRAVRNEQRGDSRTYVSIDSHTGLIAGYYSLAAWSIAHAETGGGWLARNAPDPVSVILLGRLATSVEAQGLGLGRDLVADALDNAGIAASVLAARALVAEAIDETAERFYTRLGFWQSKVRHDLFAVRLTPPN